MGTLFRLVGVSAVFFAGWYMGALLGMPEPFAALTHQDANNASEGVSNDKEQVYKEEPGSPFVIATSPSLKPQATSIVPSFPRPVANLTLCKMKVSNAPAVDEDRKIKNLSDTVMLNGIKLISTPVTKGCLSSGYGPRSGRQHKGIDFFSKSGGDVIAAADGVIVDFVYREKDFGYMIVIDHGDKVYTRYAHLAKFADGLSKGTLVANGTILGPIGQTGRAFAPHLHYEVLSGTYVNGAGSFGLKAHDPLNP